VPCHSVLSVFLSAKNQVKSYPLTGSKLSGRNPEALCFHMVAEDMAQAGVVSHLLSMFHSTLTASSPTSVLLVCFGLLNILLVSE